MTNPHAKAVEAALRVWLGASFDDAKSHLRAQWTEEMSDTITAYLAAMRAEGWVMVRDVGGTQPATVPWRYGDAWDGIQDGVGIGTLDALCNGYADGWNACRAAMLKGAGDGQG